MLIIAIDSHGSNKSLLSLASDKEDDLSQADAGEESSSEEFPVNAESDEETLDDEVCYSHISLVLFLCVCVCVCAYICMQIYRGLYTL